jgi:hypothetical protein
MWISITVFLAILMLLLVAYLNIAEAPRSIWFIAIAAFVIRVMFVLVDRFVFQFFHLRGDGSAFEATLWFVAEQWRSGIVLAPLMMDAAPGVASYKSMLYAALFSPVYVVFGRHPVLLRLFMALIGALVVINVFMISRELYNQKAGSYAAGIIAFFPYWIYQSGILYRDMLIIFFLSLMAYFVVKWKTEPLISNLNYLVFGSVTAMLAVSMLVVNVFAIAAFVLGILYIVTIRKYCNFALIVA